MEFCVRRDLDDVCSPVSGPVAVLYKVRSEYDHLVARIKDALVYHVNGVSGSAGHYDVISVEKITACPVVEVIGNSLSGRFIARI